LAQELQDDTNTATRRAATLIYDLITCIQAETTLTLRQAERQYAAHLAEYTWIGYGQLPRNDTRPWYLRWLRRGAAPQYAEDRQDVLELYWCLQIVMAREAGQLPAWEGIRVVRERKSV
jgi:hypothetical protein